MQSNNTVGSYQCICHNGYYLSNDNHTVYTYIHIVISVTYVKILMNVLAIMEIVNSFVIISMEAHVTVDIN